MDSFIRERCKKTSSQTHSTHFAPGTVTCVYGKPGIGKTFFVTKELPDHVSLDHTIFKSKQGTIDFFERLRHTEAPVVIDNWESLADLIGIREITGPVSKGPLVIISHTPVKLTNDTILYAMPIMTPSQLTALAPEHPRTPRLAHECQGDVRWFLQSLDYRSDARDVFRTPVELVEDIITCSSPMKYLTETLHEHGYVASTIQENYVNAKGITIETCATLAESQSLADTYDESMYHSGTWDTLMPYFLVSGCIFPAILIHQALHPKHIRPGSTWTKFQNMCMRRKKIKETRLDVDALRVLRAYVEHGQFELLKEYTFAEASVDTLNHVVIGQKLKPKLVESAKKYVRNST